MIAKFISTSIILALILLCCPFGVLSSTLSNIDNNKRIKAAYELKNQTENNLNNVLESLSLFISSDADYIIKTTVSLVHDYNGFLEEVESVLGERYMYENSQIPNKVANISAQGRNAGIEFQLFRPLPEKQYGPYKLLEIEIQIIGKINNIIDFYKVISDYTIVSVDKLSITDADAMAEAKKNSKKIDETTEAAEQRHTETPTICTDNQTTECLIENYYQLRQSNIDLFWDIFNRAGKKLKAPDCKQEDVTAFFSIASVIGGTVMYEVYGQFCEPFCIEKPEKCLDALSTLNTKTLKRFLFLLQQPIVTEDINEIDNIFIKVKDEKKYKRINRIYFKIKSLRDDSDVTELVNYVFKNAEE